MSDLKQQIRDDMKAALKARDKTRTGALRMLVAAIQTEETAGSKHELTDQEILKVIAREVKKRKESAEVYAANGRQELADTELAEAEVLSGYQPQQLDDAALASVVEKAIAQVVAEAGEATMKQMGQVMKAATELAAGAADGKRLSTAVRAALA
ncbi:GatB/YqeY domain-containing protein [Corynebacterium sp. HS2168-gen11]|uniref:GatB/YqeY domain-containing protein n=1 Tax=Corynebacterium sp. HS2168-gen11 TaxID=2974027 RepID=UPI00216B5C6C|nr:GatB/YqeY domain-containing protein [Corynebacterium sp. HS2168-gen11]MCS4535920.1 GatB/YqeY domain-containing protein [Corynebacterium sp. HS2168-gen11]